MIKEKEIPQNFITGYIRYIADDKIRICGQYYKASTIVIYDSRVVPDLKIPPITTLES